MIEIRPAGPQDAETLARLRYEFRASLNEPVEPEAGFVGRCAPWMRERLQAGAWRCWVAETGGEIVGHLWLHLIEKVPNPVPELEQHAYITNVYVRASARGAGLGARLMEAAMACCREERVDSVILWPTSRSRSLYARYGFRSPDDMMEAVLDHGRDLH
ncbi:MAG TPA: GNAT family N-acetyltransferase [Tepidiformaceae bacterium]|nr:GNAT family N-acetyltransferase [Tepidiformaceae bacterium]